VRKTIFKISFLAVFFQINSSFGNMGDISGMVLAPKKPSVFSFSAKVSETPSVKSHISKKVSLNVVELASNDSKKDSERFYPAKKKSKLITNKPKVKQSSKRVRVIGNMAQKEDDIKELSVNRIESKKTISEKINEVVKNEEDSFSDLISSSTKVLSNAFAISKEDSEKSKAAVEKSSFSDAFSNMAKSQNEEIYDLSMDRLTKPKSSVKKYQANAFISDARIKSENLKKELKNNYIAQNRYVSPLTLEDVNRESEKGIYKSITIKANKNNSKLNILQMKVGFSDESSALNSRNINNLRSFAGTVLDSPNQGVKVGVSSRSLQSQSSKQLAARRYSILHKILREEGIKEKNIIPVLTDRAEDSFSLNIFDMDNFRTTKRSGGINIFGEEVDRRYYNTLSW
jgi:hypothetical protein